MGKSIGIRKEDKMKESPHVTHDEEAKQSTVKCFIAAFVIVIGGLCLLVYGLALFQHEDITKKYIYNCRDMAKRIETLENATLQIQKIFLNHTHNYSTGLPRPEKSDQIKKTSFDRNWDGTLMPGESMDFIVKIPVL